ncbi:unnamed protein product, partial [Eretmochelys imbricata]
RDLSPEHPQAEQTTGELCRNCQAAEFPNSSRRRWCKVHQEPFKLFCNQDQMLICVICRESRAHRTHSVVPTEEAAQAYK